MPAQHSTHLRAFIEQNVPGLIPSTVEHILLIARVDDTILYEQI
jgi:hypothetical protein